MAIDNKDLNDLVEATVRLTAAAKGSASPSNGVSSSDDIKRVMFMAIRDAEACAYDYAASCEIGDERTWAFDVYERVRNSTRT